MNKKHDDINIEREQTSILFIFLIVFSSMFYGGSLAMARDEGVIYFVPFFLSCMILSILGLRRCFGWKQ